MIDTTLIVFLVLAAACGGGDTKREPVEPEPTPAPVSPVVTDDPLDKFDPVTLEVDRARTAVALPPVPSFELPTVEDGFHSIKELRVAGGKLLDTQIKVKGYVTSIDGTRFELGASTDAPLSGVVWVVEGPKKSVVKVGDRVLVTGTFTRASPHGITHPDGLIVFKSLEKLGKDR